VDLPASLFPQYEQAKLASASKGPRRACCLRGEAYVVKLHVVSGRRDDGGDLTSDLKTHLVLTATFLDSLLADPLV
jgi:hypothetical protein